MLREFSAYKGEILVADVYSMEKEFSLENTFSPEELEKRIGYCFKNKLLIKQALTHSSFTKEQKINKYGHYERLEFLGDAVLELVSSEFLFQQEPEIAEGKMTKLRSSYVCEPALAFCAKDLELGKFLRLGKGEEQSGGRYRDSIIADVVEAIIGAIYLDSGLEDAKTFIHRFILSDLENKQLFYDSKTILQEKVQKEYHTTVVYELLSVTGPEHQKLFTVRACIGDRKFPEGSGKSKKDAEQQAAYAAICELKKEE